MQPRYGMWGIADCTLGPPNAKLQRVHGHRATLGRFGALWIMTLLAIAGCLKVTAAPANTVKKPVYVTASFLDRNGLFIEDLQMGEVEIFEDNRPRKIEFMAKEEIPTVYGLFFDRSMLPEAPARDRMSSGVVPNSVVARDVACQLIDKQLGRQSIWVGAYDQLAQITFEASSDAFSAKQAVSQLVGIGPQAGSSLYSALFTAVDKMESRHEKRRVIILFLEALDADTASRIQPLKNLLASSNVELFAICFADRRARAGSMPSGMTTYPLRELTQATSGDAFLSMDYGNRFDDLGRRLLAHIRTLYTFGFTSESVPRGKGKLVIKCSRPNSRVRCHAEVPVCE